jgi:hypothetical protein
LSILRLPSPFGRMSSRGLRNTVRHNTLMSLSGRLSSNGASKFPLAIYADQSRFWHSLLRYTGILRIRGAIYPKTGQTLNGQCKRFVSFRSGEVSSSKSEFQSLMQTSETRQPRLSWREFRYKGLQVHNFSNPTCDFFKTKDHTAYSDLVGMPTKCLPTRA